MSANDSNFDFCLDVLPRTTSKDKAAALRQQRWSSGDRLVIRFMDVSPDSASLCERVVDALRPWREHVHDPILDFYADPSEPADIRIAFGGNVSWSRIGKDCRNVPSHEPTMVLALTPSSTDREVIRRARHEFGHALGLIHEHQSPAAGIRWRRERVIEFLTKQGWSKEEIEKNFFQVYNGKQTQYSRFDPRSIMLYQIPPDFTEDNISYPENIELSEADIDFISTDYFR